MAVSSSVVLNLCDSQIKKFEGITGMMTFDGKTGDPVKCAVLVKISPDGAFTFYKSVCP